MRAENLFTCAMCGGIFEKAWSDEEDAAESFAKFGEIKVEDRATVCDDCYKVLLRNEATTPDTASLVRDAHRRADEAMKELKAVNAMDRELFGRKPWRG